MQEVPRKMLISINFFSETDEKSRQYRGSLAKTQEKFSTAYCRPFIFPSSHFSSVRQT